VIFKGLWFSLSLSSFHHTHHSHTTEIAAAIVSNNSLYTPTIMGNPRRDALEYGVLITITASMATAYAFLLAYSSQSTPDGQRRKLPKVNLDEAVDMGKAWEEMKQTMSGLNKWRSSGFSSSPSPSSPPSSSSASPGDSSSSVGGAINSTKEEPPIKR
jgi:hypothetical protein